jgi:hypothetical protein
VQLHTNDRLVPATRLLFVRTVLPRGVRRQPGRRPAPTATERARRPARYRGFRWWRRQDLNPRPSGYEGLDKRPGAAT